jgi:hypothetical protein
MCHKGTLYLFFIQTSHFRTERQNFVLTVQGSAPRTQSMNRERKKKLLTMQGSAPGTEFAHAGTYATHVWDGDGEARIRSMVVAHATIHVPAKFQLARSLGLRLMPLELAVWAQNQPSLLFVEAPVQLPHSWASCTLPLLLAPVRKCLGRVLSCEPLSQVVV